MVQCQATMQAALVPCRARLLRDPLNFDNVATSACNQWTITGSIILLVLSHKYTTVTCSYIATGDIHRLLCTHLVRKEESWKAQQQTQRRENATEDNSDDR